MAKVGVPTDPWRWEESYRARVPRAELLLLGAYRRRVERENRLTELLASVVAGDPDLARAVLESIRPLREAGLDPSISDEFEVTTQIRIPAGFVLVARAAGEVVARVWFEHKAGAADQPEQLPRYFHELMSGRTGRHRQLLKIVDVVRNADVDSERPCGPARWDWHTWQDVGSLIWRTGRDDPAGGADWRASSTDPRAPARQRLRHEL